MSQRAPQQRRGGRRRREETAPAEHAGDARATSAPLLDAREAQSGAGVQRAVERQVMGLQESRGNEYVQRLMDGGSPDRAPENEPEDAREATRLPSNGQTASSRLPVVARVTMLGGMGAATLAAGPEHVRLTVRDLGGRLAELKIGLDRAGEADAVEELSEYTDELSSYMEDVNQGVDLDATWWASFRTSRKEAEAAYREHVGTLGRSIAASLKPIADAESPETFASYQAAYVELAEAAHYAFIEGSEDQLGPVKEALDTLDTFKSSVSDVLSWASNAATLAGAANTLAKLEKATQNWDKAGGVLDKVNKVTTAARAFAAISGLGKVPESYEGRIAKFERALDALDASSFFSAIPALGMLWSKYYLPTTQACLKLIRGIGRVQDAIARELTFRLYWQRVRIEDEPPRIPAEYLMFFPGGQPVLDFMVNVMRDKAPKPSPPVESFFLKRIDLFNLRLAPSNQLKSEGSRWHDTSTWGKEEKLTNLRSWVQRNRNLVWAMLYGSHDPPGR